MTYDTLCKFIAEQFTSDITTWLLGQPISLTELQPTELSLEPIRADTLVLLQSKSLILHIEFQVDPKPDIPFRCADYRLRIHRRYPKRTLHQVIIYLRKSRSRLVYQDYFQMPGLQSEFQVIRLWEQPLDPFLQSPGLLPFAILSQVQNPKQTLRTIAQALEKIPDQHQQSNLMASTAVLAGLILEKDTIYQTLRQDIMKESVIYQDIVATAKAQGIDEGEAKGRAEGEAKGRAEGEAKGRAEEKMQVAQNLLSLGMELPQIAQVTGLSIETLQQLQNRA